MNNSGKRFRDAVWLLIAQTIGAFNDNAVKSMLLLMAGALFGEVAKDRVNQQLGLLLIVPFVLFGPLAGWLSDRYSKRSVVSLALLAQVMGLLVIGVGIGLESLNLAVLGFFLLATQSAMLSPGKKGILKELVGSEKLGMAVGWMEMLTMVGILGGIYVGALAFGSLNEKGTPWDAGQLVVFAVAGLAFFSWLIFRPTPRTEPKSAKPFEIPILWSHFGALRELRSSRPLLLAALGDAWFWAFGGFFFFVLVKWAAIVGDPERFGFWFGLLGVGIMLGSMISAYVGRGRVELGIVPLGALGIPVALVCLTLSDPMSTSFNVCCVLLGVGGAFFFVPLNAFLQDRAGEERRGRVVAASNLLTNLLSIAFIGVHAFLSNYLNLNPIEELWVMTVPAVLIAGFVWYLLPEEIFRIATRALTRIFYRLSVKGVENLPKKGGALILCNHVSYADPVMIGVSLPRYLQFIAFSGLAESWLVRFVFRLTSAIPVSPNRAKEAIVKSSEKLRSGDAICIFPEGGISRVGPLLGFKKGFELIARKGQAPVVPAYLDGVWGSIFSFSDGKFLRKWPRRIPYPVRFHVGEPIPAKEATVDRVRRSMFRLAREAFSERKDLERPLSLVIKASLLRDRSAPFLVEGGGKIWTREEFYAKAKNLTGSEVKVEEMEGVDSISDTCLHLAGCSLRDEEIQTAGISWPTPELIASVMRIMETNLWHEPAFRIQMEGSFDSAWDQTWCLWAPLLGDLSVKDEGDGTLTLGNAGDLNSFAAKTFTGLAISGLGVVAMNLPDPPEDINPDDQKGAAEGSVGRILPGVEARVVSDGSGEELPVGEEGDLQVACVSGEWTSANLKARFDMEGFLWLTGT